MSWFLYRLGRWSFRRRWTVLLSWLAALALAGVGALTLAGQTSDEFTMPGLESTQAFELIEERTPGLSADGATARIVFQAPEGESLADFAPAVEETIESVVSDDVIVVDSPFEAGTISPDGRTGYATVTYGSQSIDMDEADVAALETASEIGEESGLLVAVGGDALEAVPHFGATELIGLAVALVVLIITLGTLIAAGMPLLTGLIGVGIGVGLITIATGFMSLGSTTPILATMLGLAVGIDYALFIVSRYRHEIGVGRDPEEAAGRAVGTAGSAVIFAGATVIIALVGLSIVRIDFLTQMGIAAAITVMFAVIIAVTLLPALFGFARTRILRSTIPFLKAQDPEAGGDVQTMGRRWVSILTRRRGIVFVVGLLASAVVAIPVASMELSLPDQGTAPEDSQPRIAYDLISDNFGQGANGPLLVVVDVEGVDDPEEALGAVNAAIADVDENVAAFIPAGPTAPDEAAIAEFEQQIAFVGYAIATVIPETGPSSAETRELVDSLRAALDPAEEATGAQALVTGQTAVGVDVSAGLADAFPLYLVVVVGLAFVLLVAVFRSIWVPVKAVVGFLISVMVALGLTVAIAQWGWGAGLIGIDTPGPLMSMLPLLLTGILFGLAMDYELFLVSRMREEYVHGSSADDSIVLGFQHGARVVTAAALIMISVFGSFAILVDDPIVKTIGLGLALGVAADAFLVRMTLVPAFMSLMGDKIWWFPAWLDKILPDLDVEGEKLSQRLAVEEPVSVGAR